MILFVIVFFKEKERKEDGKRREGCTLAPFQGERTLHNTGSFHRGDGDLAGRGRPDPLIGRGVELCQLLAQCAVRVLLADCATAAPRGKASTSGGMAVQVQEQAVCLGVARPVPVCTHDRRMPLQCWNYLLKKGRERRGRKGAGEREGGDKISGSLHRFDEFSVLADCGKAEVVKGKKLSSRGGKVDSHGCFKRTCLSQE